MNIHPGLAPQYLEVETVFSEIERFDIEDLALLSDPEGDSLEGLSDADFDRLADSFASSHSEPS